MSTLTQPSTVIENIEQLKQYLQVALQLEHATIPPYLTAAYSAKTEANEVSQQIIRAVAKEEMLHFALAANLLNSIGGHPDLLHHGFVPNYPTKLPTGQEDFEVSIERFSKDAVETFLKIERPFCPQAMKKVESHAFHFHKTETLEGKHLGEKILNHNNPFVPFTKNSDGTYELTYQITMVPSHKFSAEQLKTRRGGLLPTVKIHKSRFGVEHLKALTSGVTGSEDHIELHYCTIGDFYRAIAHGFVTLFLKHGAEELFKGNPTYQIPSGYFSGGGELISVTDLESALAAIQLIAGQGEGSNGGIYDSENEISHYYRFQQILLGKYYLDPNEGNDEPNKPTGRVFPVDFAAVYPVKKNPKVEDYTNSPELMKNALLFNGQYRRLLERLHEAFNGKPETLNGVFQSEMFKIKNAMDKLIRNPIPGSVDNAGPTFEMDKYINPSA